MKLLLIEDDKLTAEFVKRGLNEDGHTVDHCINGSEGAVLARVNAYDALILDLNLPDTSGYDVLKQLRAEGWDTPILMLTASSRTESVVEGLNLGADDYITKPFVLEELKARIRALLRRGGAARTEEIRLGSLVLNRLTHEVFLHDRPMKLTPKEYRLLEYFLLRPEQVITRTELLEKVWDMHFDPESNVVDVHVTRLRGKLRGDGVPSIATVRGFGYKLSLEA